MHKRTAAFTLIELLVVISIILIASSFIFIGGSGESGASLSSSQRIVSGIAQGARGQALLKNTATRIIIHNDPSDLDKYRRYFGIIYEDPDNDGQWLAATQGTYLPKGIYFDAEVSANLSDWLTTETMTLEYPRKSSQTPGQGADYYYYAFNPNGTSEIKNAYLILRAGTMIPNASGNEVSELRVTEEEEGLRAGIIFRLAGSTTFIDEPVAITGYDPNEIK